MGTERHTTEGKSRRQGGRSARVVKSVLDATITELALNGYGALNMEAVAARAGVNKTTVYRRWPQKAELVRQAIIALADQRRTIPDTGSLRSDLLITLKQFADAAQSPEGRSIILTLTMERTDPEVAALAQSLRKERESATEVVIKRAIERGDLPKGTDARLIHLALVSTVRHRVVVQQESVTDDFFVRLIDLILLGAYHSERRVSDS